MTDDTPKPWARDERGRFGAGNPGGPGGSRSRSDFRHAIENAITPEHASAVMRKATVMAIGGNTKAIELVLNRVSGRPAEAPVAPEPHNLPLPELASNDACRQASETIVASVNTGALDRKTAKTMLDGVSKAMLALKAAREERDMSSSQGRPPRPLPPAVLRAMIANFQHSGELPDDPREAGAVIRKVKAGFVVAVAEASSALAAAVAYGDLIAKPREKDPAMDAVLDEAAFGRGTVRVLARLLLRNWAKGGLDVTGPQCQHMAVPEFGSVGLRITGFLERLAKGRRAGQVRRLRKRMEAETREHSENEDAYRRWRDRADDAIVCFRYAGVRPDDPALLNTALDAAELDAFIDHAGGEDRRDVLPLFNTAATSTGEAREAAINKLQALARMGRFCG